MSDLFETGGRRARTAGDDASEEISSSSARLKRIERLEEDVARQAASQERTEARWRRLSAIGAAVGAAALAAAGTAYWRWQDATEQRGVDRHRLVVVERDVAEVSRDVAEVRAELSTRLAGIYQLIFRNSPARPASGEDR